MCAITVKEQVRLSKLGYSLFCISVSLICSNVGTIFMQVRMKMTLEAKAEMILPGKRQDLHICCLDGY